MAAVTICSDFGAQKNKVWHCFHCFPIYFPWSDGTTSRSLFSECWALSQLFHSHLSLSWRRFLVPLHFLPQGWCHLHIWGYWYFSSYGFSSSHVRMWELDHEELMPKNWYFQTVVLEKTLESPLDGTEIKTQSILKEINPEYSLQGLMLKLQYFGHLMWRANSLEKTLMLGKTEGKRRGGWQRMRCLDGIIDSMDMSLSKLREIVKDSKAWHAILHEVAKNQNEKKNKVSRTIVSDSLRSHEL